MFGLYSYVDIRTACDLQEEEEGGVRGAIAKSTIAAFLLGRGPSAIIALPPYDHPMLGREFSLVGVEPNADPGTPLGPATVAGKVYKRSYTKADVSLDCGSFESTITFK